MYCNYRGKSEGGARGKNPDASHCASSPNISSSAKAGDLFPGDHDPLEYCPKRCFKVQWIDSFVWRSEKRGAIYDNLLVDLQGSPAFDFVVFVVFLLLWFSLID